MYLTTKLLSPDGELMDIPNVLMMMLIHSLVVVEKSWMRQLAEWLKQLINKEAHMGLDFRERKT
jgi:hypothetical protein